MSCQHSWNDKGLCEYCGLPDGSVVDESGKPLHPDACRHSFNTDGYCEYCGEPG
jgi:hypothetical protein